jgi:hypothetical protein
MGDIHGLSRKQMTRGAAHVRSGVCSGSGRSAAAAVTSNRLHRAMPHSRRLLQGLLDQRFSKSRRWQLL